ncbi:hypothetical protein KXJ69_08285 [Aureisphaera sp. CAU 1614]|uniref:Uncharacterized protein n=1 Tax=Halomarinibacterium sedimenti TaxID=2857106 RepID=A0A9X1JZ15_9FLAO|nr:hypothetical protein [Halomarinibacterium sedimenti]MBW2938102.1 hypothetical protein [Halomarinibacterium sedimenti]
MHGSLSQFKAMLARKKERDDKKRVKNDSSTYNVYDTKPDYGFPKLSDAALEKVKSDIRQKIRAEKRKELIIYGTVFTIIILVILSLF